MSKPNATVHRVELLDKTYRLIEEYGDFCEWELYAEKFIWEEGGDAESGPRYYERFAGLELVAYGMGTIGVPGEPVLPYLRALVKDCLKEEKQMK